MTKEHLLLSGWRSKIILSAEIKMNKIRVVVFVDGGRVDQVLSDFTVEMVIVDNDIEGLDDEEVVTVLGEASYVYAGLDVAEVDTDVVHQIFKDIGR
jgi:hypothetical protein